ncbi:MAG: DNA cytosine methyltransferase [Cyclobacteriaceae bacterium]
MGDKIGIFSFFAGAGFLDLGFEQTSGFETLFVNEYHQPFMDIYIGARKSMRIPEPLHGHHVMNIEEFLQPKKMNELKAELAQSKLKFSVTGFIGGPPCPDFSVGGKNKGQEGENGRLSGTYINLVCQTKPDFFLFENVKGLWRTKKHRQFYESLKEKLIQSGFMLTERLINAIEYGAPQDRDRIILIGFHRDFLKNNKYEGNGTSFLWNFDWNYARLHDKKNIFSLPWGKTHPFNENGIVPKPNDVPLELTVEHWFNKNGVTQHPNSNMYFKPKAGLIKFQNIQEGDDKKKSYKRLHRWRFSPTAAYGNNEVHLHPYKARRISVAEALSLQSLPKEFVIPQNTTLTNAFKSIGNGVPFLAGKGLAVTILNFVSSLIPDFKPMLNGEVNGSKPGSIYQPATEAKQLSVLESEEQRAYSN